MDAPQLATADQSPEEAAEWDLGWSLGVLLRAYHCSLRQVLGDFPHGPRGYQTLVAVVRGEQPNQLALATYLGIDRTVMTYLIDDLVAAGLVERRLNPDDRRQRRVVATESGLDVHGELARRVREAEDIALGALDPAERDTFRGLLGRVACDMRHVAPERDACEATEKALADAPAPPAR